MHLVTASVVIFCLFAFAPVSLTSLGSPAGWEADKSSNTQAPVTLTNSQGISVDEYKYLVVYSD